MSADNNDKPKEKFPTVSGFVLKGVNIKAQAEENTSP
jgi:hypothetical protein